MFRSSNRFHVLLMFMSVALLPACASHAPYAGWQSREIKALSADDIEGLKSGKGMSLALAAELNGYPGPMHVLELAGPLALSADQRRATQDLLQRMRTQAVAAGEALIVAERDLDRLFATQSVTPQTLSAALNRVSQAQARVREAHLQAHLEQTRILSASQVSEYRRLRGYQS